jgi:predicted nucleic acid-binding protein
MRRIYLDSNILISHFSKDKAEETKRQMVGNALSVFADLRDVQLCTSMWAITEMVNILVSQKKIAAGRLPRLRASL